MSYLALYRKYRPVDFDNVYGQEEVVTVIKNAINNNMVSHAYLFCGPRGTGKTTIAKIIARMVNCENLIDGKPCGKCYNCINFLNSNDIVEIDAASNNGVDEIRELRDKINLVPSNAKYKVYIIDEVHMLTTQAFNALLKTLEEPPAHVIFILATTEPHKIPLTIASRCQKFRFTKINSKKIVDRLREIAKLENIAIDEDALYEIARISDGGMRDAINFLDQLVAYDNKVITLDDIYKVNGSVSYNDIYLLLKSIADNNKVEIIRFFDTFDSSGKDINKFASELTLFLKDVILYSNAKLLSDIDIKNENIVLVNNLYDSKTIYELIEKLNEIQNFLRTSTHSCILFMTAILKFSDNYFGNLIDDNLKKKVVDNATKNENKIISQEIIETNINKVDNRNEQIKSEVNIENINIRINNALATANKDSLRKIKEQWSLIDDYLYDDAYSVVAGLLKDSIPVVASEKYIIVSNSLESVANRINDNFSLIDEFLLKIFKNKIFIVGMSSDNWNVEKNKYISNIKNGVKYIEKEFINTDKIENKKSSVDELIDLMGENIIEYK